MNKKINEKVNKYKVSYNKTWQVVTGRSNFCMPYTPTTWCSMSSLINLASGLAPAAEISASNDRQDASGLAPDAINFMKNQTYDYSFVSSAGLAPAVLTIANMMGSDLPIGFGPVGFWDRQGSNFESCVWRTVSSQSSHHPQEVLLAQFSLYVHKGGLKPDSFHFISSNRKHDGEWFANPISASRFLIQYPQAHSYRWN